LGFNGCVAVWGLQKICVLREAMTLSVRCKPAFLAVSVVIFLIVVNPFCAFALTEADARSAIVAAENRIADCYRAAADAEKAGANITGLLSTLNEAGELLAKANLAYTMGDFVSAHDSAVQSQAKLDGFVPEADALRESAMKAGYSDFMVNVLGSIVGTVVVICGGFFVWVLLKRRYEKTGSVIA
jgi:hypothetical protein